MMEMSKTQRAAIVEAHQYRVEHPNGQRDGHVQTKSGARNQMIMRLIRARMLDDSGRVVFAGLVAAGVDMDAIHTEALEDQAKANAIRVVAEHDTVEAPRYLRLVGAVAQTGNYRAALDILHAEALTEDAYRVELKAELAKFAAGEEPYPYRPYRGSDLRTSR